MLQRELYLEYICNLFLVGLHEPVAVDEGADKKANV